MVHRIRKASLFLFIIGFLLTSQAFAQKKDLTLDDYAQWERLSSRSLSPDGSWFAYQIVPVEGDGWLVVKDVGSDNEHKFMHASRPSFSNNNEWFAFAIGVSEDEEKKLEKAKKKVQLKLGIMDLATALVDTFEHVESFSFSDDGRFLAMKKYKAEGVKTAGTDLVVRSIEARTNQNVGNVAEFSFSDEGALLAVLIDASEQLGNGAQLMDLNAGTVRVLESDEAKFSGLKWSEEDAHLAFLKEVENDEYEDPDHLIHAFTNVDGNITRYVLDREGDVAFPEGYRIASEGALRWSEDGGTVFLGLKELVAKKDEDATDEEDEKSEDAESSDEDEEDGEDEKAEKPKTAKDRDADLDPPGVDIWHWKDAVVQPQQNVRAGQDRRFTYLSAWSLIDGSFAKLADGNLRRVILTGDQKHAIVYDATPYEPAFRERWNDIYVVDVMTGEKKKVLERHESGSASPGGKYLLYFDNDNWWTYDIAADRHANITGDIPTRFNNFKAIYGRENDRQFGNAQWAEGDEWVLLYDQYDVYKVWPEGSRSERLTFGADDRVRFRQTRVDFEEDYLPTDAPIYFSAYGDFTKDSGYYRLDKEPGTEDMPGLKQLVYEPRSVSSLMRAKDAGVFVFQSQKADESPNFFLVDESFDAPIQLTNTNPQQEEYNWARTELVTYTNANGVELQGRLLYPADYQDGQQYPMMVYIYELRSQSLHSYTLPSRTSAYNQRRFSSEGYFVFEPDIVYRLRDPGVSAVECIVPAVEEVLETGMIDPGKIGLTGHSWGAYQTAFVITQTDMFAAAVAGAPLTNMISMYNSVYWNSGGTDARIFEVSQGRFPDPYWDDWDKFVENSPIFNVQNTNTPLLVAFGDNDGAVDFNQGVELYNTMRRMEKPFVLLVYEGENHGLRKKENQLDYANRSHDWFNHFLLGREPAKWITDGIPFLEKDLEKKKQKDAKKKESSG